MTDQPDRPDHPPHRAGPRSVPPPPGELPVVDGGGIPDLEPSGISELEAAAIFAGVDEADLAPDLAPGADEDAAGPAAPDGAIPMAGDDAFDDGPAPVSVAPADGRPQGFRAIGIKAARHEDAWNRTPNATGTGAIHVQTFTSKLTEDGFRALDARINEWLDAHPQYEVKFTSTTIGVVTGKLKEPHLICQVWV
ncbi:MAG: hypothetical protein ACYTEV_04115 [Planctomycetota bacterium]|jgi:hypothetical protein